MEKMNRNAGEVIYDEFEAERAAGVQEEETAGSGMRVRGVCLMECGVENEEENEWENEEENDEGFCHNNRGMGTVEIILIIVVLVGLVIIFKDQITQIVNSLFGKITQQTGGM